MSLDHTLSAGVRAVSVRRRGERLDRDVVVVEEPLEIRVDDKPLVVTMRTPGHDEELTAGFLYGEQVVARGAEIAAIRAEPGSGTAPSQIRVTNFSGDRVHVELRQGTQSPATKKPGRAFRATAACGVCGKEQLEDLQQDWAPIAPVALPIELLEVLPGRLREQQTLFDQTGGIHAAGLFNLEGSCLCVREDIGRHNAVDKVIGHFVLKDDVPLTDRILVVSGRAGFELVQKALQAAIPVMVAVGAASSLAAEMATDAGMALYSFAASGRWNLHVKP